MRVKPMSRDKPCVPHAHGVVSGPMRFACENCQTRYTLADEKIRGRVLKIRCRQCSVVMVVRDPELPPMEGGFGASPGDSAESSLAFGTPGPDDTRQISAAAVNELLKASRAEKEREEASGEDATRIVSVASVQALLRESEAEAKRAPAERQVVDPVARAEELRRAITGGGASEEWWAIVGGEQMGPLSRQRVLDQVRDGTLNQRSYVWIDGMSDWQRVEEVESLATALGIPPAVQPAAIDQEAEDHPAASSQGDDGGPGASGTVAATEEEPSGPWEDETEPVADGADVSAAERTDPWGREAVFPDQSTRERILADIAEETGPTEIATAGAPPPSQPVPPKARPEIPWRTLRLAGAGALLAASFAAGAWFFVPGGSGEERTAPPIAAGSRVVLADFELPERAPLDRTAVGEALAARVAGFSRCVETHPPAAGQRRIQMRAVVAPSGAVTSASVASGDPSGELGICLADRTRDIRFPPFKGEALVLNFPLLLVGKGP